LTTNQALGASANAQVNASSYGGAAVTVNQANADRSVDVLAGTGNNANLSAGRDVTVQSKSSNGVQAIAMGDAYGVIGVGPSSAGPIRPTRSSPPSATAAKYRQVRT